MTLPGSGHTGSREATCHTHDSGSSPQEQQLSPGSPAWHSRRARHRGCRRRARSAGQLQHQDTHQHGVRRRGHLRRPGGFADRHRGAPQGWQRGRRRGRDGGCPRRHRAVQLRHRWRRLLRALQRAHRQGGHARRPRDRAARACRTTRSSTPRPGKPYPQTPENPALVTSGVSVGTPGTLATWEKRARQVGLHQPRQGAAPGDEARRARLRGRHAPSTSRPRTTSCGSPSSPRPAGCSCRAASRPRSARCSATPTSPPPTG